MKFINKFSLLKSRIKQFMISFLEMNDDQEKKLFKMNNLNLYKKVCFFMIMLLLNSLQLLFFIKMSNNINETGKENLRTRLLTINYKFNNTNFNSNIFLESTKNETSNLSLFQNRLKSKINLIIMKCVLEILAIIIIFLYCNKKFKNELKIYINAMSFTKQENYENKENYSEKNKLFYYIDEENKNRNSIKYLKKINKIVKLFSVYKSIYGGNNNTIYNENEINSGKIIIYNSNFLLFSGFLNFVNSFDIIFSLILTKFPLEMINNSDNLKITNNDFSFQIIIMINIINLLYFLIIDMDCKNFFFGKLIGFLTLIIYYYIYNSENKQNFLIWFSVGLLFNIINDIVVQNLSFNLFIIQQCKANKMIEHENILEKLDVGIIFWKDNLQFEYNQNYFEILKRANFLKNDFKPNIFNKDLNYENNKSKDCENFGRKKMSLIQSLFKNNDKYEKTDFEISERVNSNIFTNLLASNKKDGMKKKKDEQNLSKFQIQKHKINDFESTKNFEDKNTISFKNTVNNNNNLKVASNLFKDLSHPTKTNYLRKKNKKGKFDNDFSISNVNYNSKNFFLIPNKYQNKNLNSKLNNGSIYDNLNLISNRINKESESASNNNFKEILVFIFNLDELNSVGFSEQFLDSYIIFNNFIQENFFEKDNKSNKTSKLEINISEPIRDSYLKSKKNNDLQFKNEEFYKKINSDENIIQIINNNNNNKKSVKNNSDKIFTFFKNKTISIKDESNIIPIKNLIKETERICLKNCYENKNLFKISFDQILKNFYEILYKEIPEEKIIWLGSKKINLIENNSELTYRIYLKKNSHKKTIEFLICDITSIIKLEQIKERNKIKNIFIKKFSHEFRNPLINICQLCENILPRFECNNKNNYNESFSNNFYNNEPLLNKNDLSKEKPLIDTFLIDNTANFMNEKNSFNLYDDNNLNYNNDNSLDKRKLYSHKNKNKINRKTNSFRNCNLNNSSQTNNYPYFNNCQLSIIKSATNPILLNNNFIKKTRSYQLDNATLNKFGNLCNKLNLNKNAKKKLTTHFNNINRNNNVYFEINNNNNSIKEKLNDSNLNHNDLVNDLKNIKHIKNLCNFMLHLISDFDFLSKVDLEGDEFINDNILLKSHKKYLSENDLFIDEHINESKKDIFSKPPVITNIREILRENKEQNNLINNKNEAFNTILKVGFPEILKKSNKIICSESIDDKRETNRLFIIPNEIEAIENKENMKHENSIDNQCINFKNKKLSSKITFQDNHFQRTNKNNYNSEFEKNRNSLINEKNSIPFKNIMIFKNPNKNSEINNRIYDSKNYIFFEFEKILKKIIKIFLTKITLLEKNIKISYEIDSNFPKTIKFDLQKITQILFNLISNAVKFSNFCIIIIKAEYKNFEMAFKIADSGMGIDKRLLEKIGSPFICSNTRNNIYGTGIGLYLVKKYVYMLEGEFIIESEKSKGTIITLRFRYDKDYYNKMIEFSNRNYNNRIASYKSNDEKLLYGITTNREKNEEYHLYNQEVFRDKNEVHLDIFKGNEDFQSINSKPLGYLDKKSRKTTLENFDNSPISRSSNERNSFSRRKSTSNYQNIFEKKLSESKFENKKVNTFSSRRSSYKKSSKKDKENIFINFDSRISINRKDWREDSDLSKVNFNIREIINESEYELENTLSKKNWNKIEKYNLMNNTQNLSGLVNYEDDIKKNNFNYNNKISIENNKSSLTENYQNKVNLNHYSENLPVFHNENRYSNLNSELAKFNRRCSVNYVKRRNLIDYVDKISTETKRRKTYNHPKIEINYIFDNLYKNKNLYNLKSNKSNSLLESIKTTIIKENINLDFDYNLLDQKLKSEFFKSSKINNISNFDTISENNKKSDYNKIENNCSYNKNLINSNDNLSKIDIFHEYNHLNSNRNMYFDLKKLDKNPYITETSFSETSNEMNNSIKNYEIIISEPFNRFASNKNIITEKNKSKSMKHSKKQNNIFRGFLINAPEENMIANEYRNIIISKEKNTIPVKLPFYNKNLESNNQLKFIYNNIGEKISFKENCENGKYNNFQKNLEEKEKINFDIIENTNIIKLETKSYKKVKRNKVFKSKSLAIQCVCNLYIEKSQATDIITNYASNNLDNMKNFVKNKQSTRNILRILIVDDEHLIRQSSINVLRKYLNKKNFIYEIEECSDGIDCLYKIYKGYSKGITYDIIITDETMNFLNGSQMAKIIKNFIKEKLINEIKIFMVTSYEWEEMYRKYSDVLDMIYTKPLSINTLDNIFSI